MNYIGGSQGGIMGGTTVALAPNLDRGVLVVGGANYSLMVWRSTSFAAVNDLWEGSQPDRLDREFLFALYQSAFDLSDPVIYSELIRDAPLPGNAPKQLLLIEAIGDSQVPNIATEAMARNYGMLMLGAAIYPVFGVPTLAGPIDDLALLQVDTKRVPCRPSRTSPATATTAPTAPPPTASASRRPSKSSSRRASSSTCARAPATPTERLAV